MMIYIIRCMITDQER